LIQVEFEGVAPGAIFAGRAIRNLKIKRVPSNPIFTAMPKGEDLDNLIDEILLKATGEWKTVALFVHEAGMDCTSARRQKWENVSEHEVRWKTPAGEFEVYQSPLLKNHLSTLPRNSEYVSPTVAIMHGAWASADFRKALSDLPPSLRRVLRRYSIWPAIVARNGRLAAEGRRPQQKFTPTNTDLKECVRTRLKAILSGSSEPGRVSASTRISPFRPATIEEIKLLTRNLAAEWQLAIYILYYLFVSVGELCRLSWDRLDLKAGVAMLAGRKVPIHPALLKYFRKWPGPKVGKLVSFKSDPLMNSAAIKIFRNAGITDGDIRLTSIRMASLQLLEKLGVKLDRRGKVIMAGAFGGTKPTQHAKSDRLKKALMKFPDIGSQ
jgi:integrase